MATFSAIIRQISIKILPTERINCCSYGTAKISFPVIPKGVKAGEIRGRSILHSPGSLLDSAKTNVWLTLEQEQHPDLQAGNDNIVGKKNEIKPQRNFTQNYFDQLKARLYLKYALDKEIRKLLIFSASQLYYDCANNYNYIVLHKEFGLDDSFFSWYRLTLLHLWMACVRLQQSMEVYSYCFYRRQLTEGFHTDKTNRYNTVYENDKLAVMTRRRKFTDLYYHVFMSSIFEYDDGFLGNDQHLAGALWRSLYMQDKDVDIVHLNNAVRYMRSTMHFLDGLDANQILKDGIDHWLPSDEIAQIHWEHKR